VGSERTMQSGVIWGDAIYGAETRPVNFYARVPYPVPINSIPDTLDTLIEARKGPCANRLAADVESWDEKYGYQLWKDAEIVRGLSEMCGENFTNERVEELVGKGTAYVLGDAIKDITDAIIFDYIEDFPPLPGWSWERFSNYAKFANDQLQKRLYGTPEQVTYMNGALPPTLLANFDQAIHGTSMKIWAYHAHREMTYALGWMLGIDWNFLIRPGIPPTAVAAATTMFFELHWNNTWYVETWVWAPCLSNNETGAEIHAVSEESVKSRGFDCPAALIHLPGCDSPYCSYPQFKKIINDHIAKTDTWDKLCGYKSVEESAIVTNENLSLAVSSSTFYQFLSFFLAIACVSLGVAYYNKGTPTPGYSQLPDVEI